MVPPYFKVFWLSKDDSAGYSPRNKKKTEKKWGGNSKEWTGMDFARPTRAAEERLVGWLVVLGKRPFETVLQSISGRLPKRGRKRREWIDESKNVQTTPTRTYCERSWPFALLLSKL